MLEYLVGVWGGVRSAWRHRKALARLPEIGDAIDEAEQLRAENAELRERLEVKESLTWREGVFWQPQGESGQEIPVCPKCYQDDEKVIFLSDAAGQVFRCPKCENYFRNPDAPPPPPREPRGPRGGGWIR